MTEKTILVTGGLGFIGSNFIDYYHHLYPNHHIINLDKVTYAACQDLIGEWSEKKHYHFFEGDICNSDLVDKIFNDYKPDQVIHFAAESHVDNSIKNASEFITTNVYGTYVLINTAQKYWSQNSSQLNKFLHVSTDEVYGSLGETGYFSENSQYQPNSPYSASKASSDLIVRSYNKTHGLQTIITNCSNNFGPRQHDEKLIPTIIRKAIKGDIIPIYGDGKNVRDWLFVKDHCIALTLLLDKGVAGEKYNIGGNCELENLDIANHICQYLDKIYKRDETNSFVKQIQFVKDRLGHDRRYAIDSSKIEENLQWKASGDFSESLETTIHWYLKKYE